MTTENLEIKQSETEVEPKFNSNLKSSKTAEAVKSNSNLDTNNEDYLTTKNKINVRDPDNYILELREENKKRRLAEESAKKELEKIQKELMETKNLFENAQKKAIQEKIFSELKTEAIKAGIHNIDDIYKLADISKVSLNDRGEVIGASDEITNLKSSRPYLFRDNSSTSLGHQVPHPKKMDAKKENLTKEERSQKVAEIVQRYS